MRLSINLSICKLEGLVCLMCTTSTTGPRTKSLKILQEVRLVKLIAGHSAAYWLCHGRSYHDTAYLKSKGNPKIKKMSYI